MYYTVSKDKRFIDSISEDIELLMYKFPGQKIYKSDKPITSIYVENEIQN